MDTEVAGQIRPLSAASILDCIFGHSGGMFDFRIPLNKFLYALAKLFRQHDWFVVDRAILVPLLLGKDHGITEADFLKAIKERYGAPDLVYPPPRDTTFDPNRPSHRISIEPTAVAPPATIEEPAPLQAPVETPAIRPPDEAPSYSVTAATIAASPSPASTTEGQLQLPLAAKPA